MGNPFLDFGPDRIKSYSSGLALNAVTRKIPAIYVDKEEKMILPSLLYPSKEGKILRTAGDFIFFFS